MTEIMPVPRNLHITVLRPPSIWCVSFFDIRVHFIYRLPALVPARFVTFFVSWNEKLRFGSVEPSPATVHRTVAFDGSNLAALDFSKTKSTPSGSFQ